MPNYFGDHRLRRDDFVKPKQTVDVSKLDSVYLMQNAHCQYSGKKLLKPMHVGWGLFCGFRETQTSSLKLKFADKH